MQKGSESRGEERGGKGRETAKANGKPSGVEEETKCMAKDRKKRREGSRRNSRSYGTGKRKEKEKTETEGKEREMGKQPMDHQRGRERARWRASEKALKRRKG